MAKQIWIAIDKTEHETEEACKKHETDIISQRELRDRYLNWYTKEADLSRGNPGAAPSFKFLCSNKHTLRAFLNILIGDQEEEPEVKPKAKNKGK